MTSIFQPELIIVSCSGCLLLPVQPHVLGVWLLYKTLKKLNRLELAQAELKNMVEELHSLRGKLPAQPLNDKRSGMASRSSYHLSFNCSGGRVPANNPTGRSRLHVHPPTPA